MKSIAVALLVITPLIFSQVFGQSVFSRAFGEEEDEKALAGIQTSSGAYVVAGLTFSHGKGKSDIWVMKLSPNGQEMWRKYLGSDDFDWANDIIETREGNYVVAGYSQDPESGDNNAWVVSLDRMGRINWSHTYGGKEGDEAKSIIQTRDGGFAVAGFSHSYGEGKSDMWLLKLNEKGEDMWQRIYGDEGSDKAYDLVQTTDGGFILAGYATGYATQNTEDKADVILIKTNGLGEIDWIKNYGTRENETAEAIIATKDGNYVYAGWKQQSKSRYLDGIVMKIDPYGEKIWSDIFKLDKENKDDDRKEVFYDLDETADGSLLLAGATTSKSNMKAAFWLTKISREGEQIWTKTSEGTSHDFAYSVTATQDGGMFIAGSTDSYSAGGCDMWVVKTDASGKIWPPDTEAAWRYNPQNSRRSELEEVEEHFKPNLYILSVGVSEYKDSTVNLAYAAYDADSIVRKFEKMEGKLFREVHATLLKDSLATLTEIKKGISWLERQATQKDLILVFISSHGALDHKGNLFLLPHDFNGYHLFATGLNINDVTEGMNGTPCKKLILLDACHSGSALNTMDLAYAKSADLYPIVKELLDAEPGLTIMTSSAGTEKSFEIQSDGESMGQGIFTRAILDGLAGSADYNKDRVVNLMELNLYVTESVKELTDGQQHPFTPINQFGNIPLYLVPKEKKPLKLNIPNIIPNNKRRR